MNPLQKDKLNKIFMKPHSKNTQLKSPMTPGHQKSFLQEIFKSLKINRGPGWPDKFGNNLYKYLKNRNDKTIHTLSLFTGCGGLDIGFHDVGFKITEMVEIEEKFAESLKRNSGNKNRYLGEAKSICIDIKKYDPNFKHPIDFIIGGPPCQTFSAAGRRAAGVMGTDDQRGNLFQEYVRILKKLQPKAFLFENVYGIVGAQGGEPWELIKKSFETAGYKLFHRILDTADYGVPQHRERLIIVGIKNPKQNFCFPEPITGPDSSFEENYYTAQEAVSNLVENKALPTELNGKYGKLLNEIPPGLNYSYYTKELGYPQPIFGWRSKFSDFLYKADPQKPVRSIKAQGGQYTGPFSWKNRPFTIAEYKRLQTIPDNYELTGGKSSAIKQIGNSVPPQFARILALSILDQIFQIDLPFKMRYLSNNSKLGFRQRKKSLTFEYRKKANTQIKKMKGTQKLTNEKFSENGNQIIEMNQHFGIKTLDKKKRNENITLNCEINYKLSTKEWLFSTNNRVKETIEVIIEPIYQTWALPTKRVILKISETNERKLTTLWKFFEEKMSEVTGYADLVQLSGYYQYKPQITIRPEWNKCNDPFWIALKKVLTGSITGKEIHINDLGSLLNLPINDIQNIMKRLKMIGYEIRNHNTNPQIKEEHFLIPYSFPTLNPKSVQLHKKL